jgi:predicted nucleic acid-binding protein
VAQVVADTSPLIALHQIGFLWLFESLYAGIVIPPAVASEVAPSLPELPAFVRVQALTKPVPHGAYGIALGDGEAEVIALALELGADQVVLDEVRGRDVATRLGLKVVGTLGILRAAQAQRAHSRGEGADQGSRRSTVLGRAGSHQGVAARAGRGRLGPAGGSSSVK